jgi:ribA/ribD-fused uncharacterized protein
MPATKRKRKVSSKKKKSTNSHQNRIYFYEKGKPYYEFTNFFPAPIWIDGELWPTSEHYFQSQKFRNYPLLRKDIMMMRSPREAFEYARRYAHYVRLDWPMERDAAMHRAVHAKFTQHPNLRRKLCGTRRARLIERTSNDMYWGDGGDGSGRNQLGKTLQNVRQHVCRST